MKILIISYLFPPVNNPQAVLSARFAKYLRRIGHEVHVFAAVQGQVCNSSHGVDEALCSDLDGVSVTYVRDAYKPTFLSPLFHRAVYHETYRPWVRDVVKAVQGTTADGKIDIIYSISAPLASNMAGLAMARQTGIPWVAHFSDPMFLAMGRRFRSPVRTWLTIRDEAAVLRNANRITFVNEETRDGSMARYQQYLRKADIVGHCYDPEAFTREGKLVRSDGRVRISYVGSFYGRRNPFAAIEAVARLNAGRAPAEAWELHLYGAIEPRMVDIVTANRYPWVMIHGSISYGESIKAMMDADVLLLIDMAVERSFFTPSKLIDYLATGRPVVGITTKNSPSARILMQAGWRSCAEGCIDDLAALIREAVERRRGGHAEESHRWVAARFEASNVARELAAVLQKACA